MFEGPGNRRLEGYPLDALPALEKTEVNHPGGVLLLAADDPDRYLLALGVGELGAELLLFRVDLRGETGIAKSPRHPVVVGLETLVEVEKENVCEPLFPGGETELLEGGHQPVETDGSSNSRDDLPGVEAREIVVAAPGADRADPG